VIVLYPLLGFLLGALVNALADALPVRRPVTLPAYLTRRAPLRLRDVAVHVAALALFGYLWTRYGEEDVVELILVSFYTLVLLLVTVTDLEHRLIPNRAMLPAIAVGVLAGPVRFGSGWPYALLGGAVGFLFFYLAAWSGERALGRGALGGGDVSLATFVGLISGFPQVFVALVITLIAGGAISSVLLITRRATFRTAIPYGPFIVLGGFYAMVWGAEVIRWYASNY